MDVSREPPSCLPGISKREGTSNRPDAWVRWSHCVFPGSSGRSFLHPASGGSSRGVDAWDDLLTAVTVNLNLQKEKQMDG